MNRHCYGGIYIKSLVPGGVAEQDGRIKPGTCYSSAIITDNAGNTSNMSYNH